MSYLFVHKLSRFERPEHENLYHSSQLLSHADKHTFLKRKLDISPFAKSRLTRMSSKKFSDLQEYHYQNDTPEYQYAPDPSRENKAGYYGSPSSEKEAKRPKAAPFANNTRRAENAERAAQAAPGPRTPNSAPLDFSSNSHLDSFKRPQTPLNPPSKAKPQLVTQNANILNAGPSQSAAPAPSPAPVHKDTLHVTGTSALATISEGDRQIFEELNKVRSNPKKYSEVLKKTRGLYNGLDLIYPGEDPIETQEGVAALDECIKRLEAAGPLPPLRLSTPLCKAAKSHQIDLGTHGTYGHIGADGSGPQERMKRFGLISNYVGENISYGTQFTDLHMQKQLTDDGAASRLHRENILNPTYSKVGISRGPHKDATECCVIKFSDEGEAVK